jgi:hypothetical protein
LTSGKSSSTAAGEVGISAGPTVCVVKLVHGEGWCSPSPSTALTPGRYSVRVFYAGNYLASKSAAAGLTVRR